LSQVLCRIEKVSQEAGREDTQVLMSLMDLARDLTYSMKFFQCGMVNSLTS
jgi:hypothetical protein